MKPRLAPVVMLVCRLKSFGNLFRNGQRLIDRDRALGNSIGEGRSFDQFHDERADAVRVFDAVDVADVRMIERREHLGFATESRQAVRIIRDRREQHFDRDVAIQLAVASAVDLPHAAGPEVGEDLIRAEARAGSQGCQTGLILTYGRREPG